MAKNNRRFGPADRAVVITELLAGATVAAAAKAAGFVVQTLYDDRKRCPLFARAWADAVAESARPRLVAKPRRRSGSAPQTRSRIKSGTGSGLAPATRG